MGWTRRLSIVICIVYVVLAVLYSIWIPLSEPQDENYHYAFAQWIAETNQLPVQNPSIRQPWNQEGSQAPLYYVIASFIVRIVPGADAPYTSTSNPHAVVGIPDSRANHNVFVHTAAELFPWRGPVLAMHLIRLLGVFFGLITLIFIYLSARLAVPNVPVIAPLATAFTAFNPMFLMQMACVNNDSLVAALGAVSIWLVLLLWRRGLNWKVVWALAVMLAFTGLSKASGLAVGVVAGALLAIMAWKRCITFRQMVSAALVLGGTFAVLAGWWYIRNIQLYGDLTGLKTLSQIVGFRSEPFTLGALFKETDLLRVSFWGLYGWENIFIGPYWLPWLADALTWISLLGGIWALIRVFRARRFEMLVPMGLLALSFLLMALLVINYTWQIPASVGRLFLPVMAAISILAVYGWYAIARSIRLSWLAGLPVAGLALVAILSPFLSVAPAYAMPPVVSAPPADAIPLDVHFGTIDALGYSVPKQPVLPGDTLPITLYYRGQPDPRDLSLYLVALGRNHQPIGKVDSYPGGGMLPTSMWTPGAIYADTYYLPISADAEAPVQIDVEFGWWDFATKTQVKPVDANGNALDALILPASALLSSKPVPAPDHPQQTVFSGALRLDGYTLAPSDGIVADHGSLDVALTWESLTQVYENFNIFVHLQTDDGKLVAQADSAPLEGQYPTSLWAPNHPFVDSHHLSLDGVTPGIYRLVIGVYRLSDGSRLPVTGGGTAGDSLILQTPIVVKAKPVSGEEQRQLF